jgi:uncharacterized membrane protein
MQSIIKIRKTFNDFCLRWKVITFSLFHSCLILKLAYSFKGFNILCTYTPTTDSNNIHNMLYQFMFLFLFIFSNVICYNYYCYAMRFNKRLIKQSSDQSTPEKTS